jgi:hypothetical protein
LSGALELEPSDSEPDCPDPPVPPGAEGSSEQPERIMDAASMTPATAAALPRIRAPLMSRSDRSATVYA